MALSFENTIPTSLLSVSATATIIEGPSTGTTFPVPSPNPPYAIQCDQTTTVSFNWTTGGLIYAWFSLSQVKLDVFFEMMGPGEASFPVPSTMVSLSSGSATLAIAPNTVPEGVYRIVVRMMVLTPSGGSPSPICGFEDKGLVEFYKG